MPATAFSTEEIELIIEAVRGQPAIYDASDARHRDQQFCSNFWASIATQINKHGIDGEVVKKKWKNLRDTYARNKKEQEKRSGAGAKQPKPWRWAGTLRFLQDCPSDNASTDSNIDDDSSLSSQSSQIELQEDSEEDVEPESDALSDRSSERTIMPPPAPRKPRGPTHSGAKRSRQTGEENQSTKVFKAIDDLLVGHSNSQKVIESHLVNAHGDALDKFFDSCASRVRMLPLNIQALVQVQVQQLLFNAENTPLTIPITPLPLTVTQTVPACTVTSEESASISVAYGMAMTELYRP